MRPGLRWGLLALLLWSGVAAAVQPFRATYDVYREAAR